jgi:hypothetical protein
MTAPTSNVPTPIYLPQVPASSTAVRIDIFEHLTEARGVVLPRWLEGLLETAEILQEEGALEEIRAGEADIEAGNVVSLSDARRSFGEHD